MYTKTFFLSILAAASFVVAQDDTSEQPTPTKVKHHKQHKQAWESQHPDAASTYHSDMKSLRKSIHVSYFTTMQSID